MTKVTRRQTASGIAALVFGTGALAVTTDDADAQELEVGGLEVADVTHDSPDGMVSDVRADVTAEYAIDATTPVATLDLTLRAGRDDPDSSTSEIAATTETIGATTTSGSVDLSGPITYASAFQIADFRPSEAGEQVVVPVRLVLVADAIGEAGGTLASAETETVTEVTVRQQEDVLTFEVGGTGEVVIKE